MGDGEATPESCEVPKFYFTNPHAVTGPYDDVLVPAGSSTLSSRSPAAFTPEGAAGWFVRVATARWISRWECRRETKHAARLCKNGFSRIGRQKRIRRNPGTRAVHEKPTNGPNGKQRTGQIRHSKSTTVSGVAILGLPAAQVTTISFPFARPASMAACASKI